MDINFKNVSFVYGEKTPFEKLALDNIDLTIKKGEFVGIIGHTGSGKSTLIQHFNGILKPTSGDVFIGDMNTKDKELAKSGLRYKIGLVFQYPEYQLFEETIEKDIASKVPKKDTKIVLYCNTGNRSGQAFEKLKKLGYTNVSTSARKEGTEQSVIEYNKEDYFIALKVAKELGITDMIENNDLSNKIGVTIK